MTSTAVWGRALSRLIAWMQNYYVARILSCVQLAVAVNAGFNAWRNAGPDPWFSVLQLLVFVVLAASWRLGVAMLPRR